MGSNGGGVSSILEVEKCPEKEDAEQTDEKKVEISVTETENAGDKAVVETKEPTPCHKKSESLTGYQPPNVSNPSALSTNEKKDNTPQLTAAKIQENNVIRIIKSEWEKEVERLNAKKFGKKS